MGLVGPFLESFDLVLDPEDCPELTLDDGDPVMGSRLHLFSLQLLLPPNGLRLLVTVLFYGNQLFRKALARAMQSTIY